MYEFEKVKDKEIWDKFVINTIQNSIFSQSKFLDAITKKYDLFFVKKKERIILGVIIFSEKVLENEIPYTGNLFQGLFLNEKKTGSLHSKTNERLDSIKFLIGNLKKEYKNIFLSLNPSLTDIRPFLWNNFDFPNETQFVIENKFTAQINLRKFDTFDVFLKNLSSVRKQEYKKAIKNNLIVKDQFDIEVFKELFKKTFSTTEKELKKNIKYLEKVLNSSKENSYGKAMSLHLPDGEAISATLFLYDENQAYYLHGLNDYENRDYFGNTFLMIENIKFFMNQKIKKIDLLGVNSPDRSYFKSSFNGDIKPYFNIVYNKNF